MRIFALTDISHTDPVLKNGGVNFDLAQHCQYAIPQATGDQLISEGRVTVFEGQVYFNDTLI